MNLQKYLLALRRRWLVAILGVVVGLAGGLAVFLFAPARYTAYTSLFVVTRLTDETSAAYQGAQLSELRAKSYAELVSSTRVSEEVAQRLSLPTPAEKLAKEITATSAPDSVVIDVSVTDGSPTRATQIANTVAAVMVDVVNELERPDGASGPNPAISVRVVQPAAVPSTRSPSLAVTLGIGMLAGLVAGIAGALAWNKRDDSVRSFEQLRTVTGAPNLGVLAYDASVPMRTITLHDDPAGPHAEAFRRVRNNLQFIGGNDPPRVVAVTSALPEEGKTTVVLNLAAALGAAGYRVATVEADLRRPVMADLLGLDRAVGLSSALARPARPTPKPRNATMQAVQSCGTAFDVLAAGPCPPDPGELVASRSMKAVLAELRTLYDFVLIDCPPLLPLADTASIAPALDGVILVCRYNTATQAQLSAAVESLRSVSANILGTILTMAPVSMTPASMAPPSMAQLGKAPPTKTPPLNSAGITSEHTPADTPVRIRHNEGGKPAEALPTEGTVESKGALA